jgi:hypothetical protein
MMKKQKINSLLILMLFVFSVSQHSYASGPVKTVDDKSCQQSTIRVASQNNQLMLSFHIPCTYNNALIELYDLMGNLVYSRKIEKDQGKCIISLSEIAMFSSNTHYNCVMKVNGLNGRTIKSVPVAILKD